MNRSRLALGASLLLSALASASALAAPPTLDELLSATDEVARGQSSHAIMEMHVKTDRYERTMGMEAWSKGEEMSLVRITAPAKDAGISTLMVGDNIWNHLPKVDRTMKLPAAMMSGSWMGSHFTNDDLVKSSTYEEDFTSQLVSGPDLGGSYPVTPNYVIDSTPKPDAPVVWGKVRITISPARVPVSIEYFEEDGALSRTMTFTDEGEVSGRLTPMKMRLQPADKPDELTEITYKQLELDVPLDDSMFSLQSLK